MALLTIAIPTFDRNDLLRRHVAELLPQLTPGLQLMILDNASPTPVEMTLREVRAQHPQADVRIIRHRVNIGASANVMRCLEYCETPWLWVLGDDDRPLPEAVATALTVIEHHQDCLFISFNGMYAAVERETQTSGLENFVHNIPSFANMTLISDNLLHVARMQENLRSGYYYGYSLYPVLACLLTTLAADGGRCAFVPQQLIEWGPNAEWSRIMAGKGFGVLLDIPMPSSCRGRIGQCLNDVVGRYSTYAIHLLNQIDQTMDPSTARHLFLQAWYRLYRYQRSPLKWIHRGVGYSLLRFPRLGRALYQRYRSWRGYPETKWPANEMART